MPVRRSREATHVLNAVRFRKQLLGWYDGNKRSLPWRENADPYRVWVSEIMLQQTRVNAVMAYYQRFMERFPTVAKLAAAREATVLAAWSGLGYYRRARMMHAAAKQIVAECDGKFPDTAEALRELPGIGRYTSAAIASIAFNQAIAVVDGNVERVIARTTGNGHTGETLWEQAQQLLDVHRPGDFNQAMMELGATVCVPRGPLCLTCPVIEHCRTRGMGQSEAKKSKQSKRDVSYVLDLSEGSVVLVQRPKAAALMPGMWELPMCPHDTEAKAWLTLRHSITTTDYTVRIVKGAENAPEGRRVGISKINGLPLTGLTRKVLRAAKII